MLVLVVGSMLLLLLSLSEVLVVIVENLVVSIDDGFV
jgi:hypothetical protein